VADFRYSQFCALARAAEVVGERWTLLILRELLLGAKRFSDLRERLDGISASVLSKRLARLQGRGLVTARTLEPPLAATVYELSDTGRALAPTLHHLLRWGARFLRPGRPRERVEADWLRLALAACGRRTPTPARSILLRIRGQRGEFLLRVTGGAGGTTVTDRLEPAEATVVADPQTVMGLMTGALSAQAALREGRVRVEGDPAALEAFPALFEIGGTGESSPD